MSKPWHPVCESQRFTHSSNDTQQAKCIIYIPRDTSPRTVANTGLLGEFVMLQNELKFRIVNEGFKDDLIERRGATHLPNQEIMSRIYILIVMINCTTVVFTR